MWSENNCTWHAGPCPNSCANHPRNACGTCAYLNAEITRLRDALLEPQQPADGFARWDSAMCSCGHPRKLHVPVPLTLGGRCLHPGDGRVIECDCTSWTPAG